MSAAELVSYNELRGGRHVAVLVTTGRRWAHVITMWDKGIKVRKVNKAERRYMRPMPDYPIKRAARMLLDAGARFGITKAARRALRAEVGR